jgi:hypothetical protein
LGRVEDWRAPAHLTLDGVGAAVAVTRKPLLLSHTVLETGEGRRRQLPPPLPRGGGRLIPSRIAEERV